RGDGHEVTVAYDKRMGFIRGFRGDMRLRVTSPPGADVEVSTASADVNGRGAFGALDVNCASGNVTFEHIAAGADVNSASGDVKLSRVEDALAVNTASGDLEVGYLGGDGKVRSASGDVSMRALLAAEVISTTGAQMTWLALPWFVLTTSGSATRMSFVVAAEVIGMGLLTLPGSRLLSRVGARRAMLLCDAVRAPLIVLVPALHWAGALSFPLLLTIAFALGAMTSPYFAAQ